MDRLQQLRKLLIGEELDYQFLLHALRDYAKPRDKISRYLRNGDLIRVKKGLYVFGESYRQNLISLEVLANLIYGPSYLSLEYALSFYGFIPERVECLTSMTTQKNKLFHTPLGVFSYQHIALHKYREGLVQQTRDGRRYFIMASPEKAILDVLDQHPPFSQLNDLLEFLCHDLRIEESYLKKLSIPSLTKLTKIYNRSSAWILLKWLKSQSLKTNHIEI
jgi:hypothetical protein